MNPRLTRLPQPEPGPGLSRPVQGGLYAAAFLLVPLLAIVGSDSFRAALDFTTGVLSLVSLSASVAWGLLATDRVLLAPRQRLLAQGIHRTTAIASLGFLLLHATVKVSLGHTELIGALIPFGLGVTGSSALIGLGSLAGFLMVVAGTTGALRSALAGNVKVAGRWRPLHMLAYPAWCFALMHGLYAGRPAAGWVTTLYCLALAGVAAAVSVRLLPVPVQRRVAARILALTGGGDARPPAAEEQAQRDLSVSPLPGSGGMSGAAAMNGSGFARVPAGMDRMDRMDRPGGTTSSRPPAEEPSPLGQTRVDPPRLAAPSPPLYEAPPPPDGEPGAAAGGRRGPGMAAAYRAVSRAGDQPPLAERVPMTEEIPVVAETGPQAGAWPTPSPPPPAQAVRPEPAAYSGSGSSPLFDQTPPPFDTASREDPRAFGTPDPYGAAPEPPASYGRDAYSSADPYGTASGYAPPAEPFPGSGPFPGGSYPDGSYPDGGAAAGGYAAGGYPGEAAPGGGPLGPEDTAAMPGPLFPPPAGEPWNAPAGERP
ncbi:MULTISPECIES: hypothetical protein [Streptomyces]|uniref:Ferric reductase-like transmembrane domain-containing protein n=1 Tax=Streptomyces sanyensis TaxID=568869 RepID=A0ABP8ZWF4_9ACTN